MSKYYEIKDEFSKFTHKELFYAFSNDQFAEGMKNIPEGEKVFKGGMGDFGTIAGFKARQDALDHMHNRITKECTAQQIYDYEYGNYECGYTGNDSQAYEIAKEYFPNMDIKRKKHYN